MWLTRKLILGWNAIEYSQDFASLSQKVLVLFNSKQMHPEANCLSSYIIQKQTEYMSHLSEYGPYDINVKVKQFLELLALYTTTNSQILIKNP